MPPLLLLALSGCVDPWPQAFDYHIDRTLVAGLRLAPRGGRGDVPRDYEAFVLSPYEILGARAEICGLRTDMLSYVAPDCFAEPALVTEVATGRSGRFTLPPLAYDCPEPWSSPSAGGSGLPGGSGGSGHTWTHGHQGLCSSSIPWRIAVESQKDTGYGYAELSLLPSGLPEGPPVEAVDPATAELRIEQVDGELTPGGQVYLRASFSEGYAGSPASAVFRWYVDDGELLGTGRTGARGTGGGRIYADNTLLIPDDYRNDQLRVAVVLDNAAHDATTPMVWDVLTLEAR